MVIDNIGAEEKHAAIVLPDLGKAQNFGEEAARPLDVFYLQNQMADSANLKSHVILRYIVSTILPKCSRPSIYRWAARASARGKVLSMGTRNSFSWTSFKISSNCLKASGLALR